jgi:hypothetical protein
MTGEQRGWGKAETSASRHRQECEQQGRPRLDSERERYQAEQAMAWCSTEQKREYISGELLIVGARPRRWSSDQTRDGEGRWEGESLNNKKGKDLPTQRRAGAFVRSDGVREPSADGETNSSSQGQDSRFQTPRNPSPFLCYRTTCPSRDPSQPREPRSRSEGITWAGWEEEERHSLGRSVPPSSG